jgi:HSP20 family molecular chaperone IbpA
MSRILTPAVDIQETAEHITLFADLPGVKAQDLAIDVRGDVLTLTAKPETGTFFRQFTLSDAIDQSKIEASLVDGVLRLELPKVEKMRPRQISVKTG